MENKNYSVKLWGKIQGRIWWPQEICEKDFSVTFAPNHKPFVREWAGIRDALLHITNDGDFQNAELLELFGEVTYYRNWGKIVKYMKFNQNAEEYKDLLCEDFFTD